MIRPPGIKEIRPVDDLGESPAKCFKHKGLVLTNNKVFPKLPKSTQEYILGHEAGHIVRNTNDEHLADDFATDWCLSQKMKLTDIIFALTRVLKFPDHRPKQKAEQLSRINRQLERLLKYDYEVNKNEKANPMKTFDSTIENPELGLYLTEEGMSFLGIELGLTKASRERKKENHDAKIKKKDAKANLINAKASKKEDTGAAKLLKAQAKENLSEMGVDSSLGGQLAGMAKAKQGPSSNDTPEEEKLLGMPKKTAIIVIAVVVVVVAVAIWFFKFRKK